MRILLDQAVYDQRNKGNVALLQAAIARLSELWPGSTIQVLTEAPHLLKLYCPNVHPVSVHPSKDWSQKQTQIHKLHRFIPPVSWQLAFELRDEAKHRRTHFAASRFDRVSPHESAVNANQQLNEGTAEQRIQAAQEIAQAEENNRDLMQAIEKADLIVATGGGYLCDADKEHTPQVFETLEMAVRLDKPAAMVGQGVGPLDDPDLRARLGKLLPKLDLILIREPKLAYPLLESLGVARERVIMTGDDAIEMAFNARSARMGDCIGVNLRAARYTQVDQKYIDKVRPALHQAARNYGATLLALPISVHPQEDDLGVIRQLLSGYDKVSIDWQRFDLPLNVIKKTALCRLVVTGSFHPAVFALAQGIPVVGLVKSIAYKNKFGALRDEFGSACQLIDLDDEYLGDKLAAAIDTAWTSARGVRPQLLQAAVRQIEWGRAGYRKLFDLVLEKKAARPNGSAAVMTMPKPAWATLE